MSPVLIAMLNTVFRAATILVLLPFIKWIEKIVYLVVKDSPEDEEDQADFDLLEERFLAYPDLAITQSHLAMNGGKEGKEEYFTCVKPVPCVFDRKV